MNAQRLNTACSWSVCCLIDYLRASYLLVCTVVVRTVKVFSVDNWDVCAHNYMQSATYKKQM